MLSPVNYLNDCKLQTNSNGAVFDHKFHSRDESSKLFQQTQKIWHRRYPNEPFDYKDLDLKEYYEKIKSYNSTLCYNVVSAAQRQYSFYYQVSHAHYKEYKFLQDGLTRYRMFLMLKKLNREVFVVPTYDIDLIWHTHQLHPRSYIKDCLEIFSRILPHDDDVGERASGSELTKSYTFTKELWHKHYGIPYPKEGAMFKGESPTGELLPLEEAQDFDFRKIKLRVQKIEIENLDWIKTEKASIKLDHYCMLYRPKQLDRKTRIFKETIYLRNQTKLKTSTKFKIDGTEHKFELTVKSSIPVAKINDTIYMQDNMNIRTFGLVNENWNVLIFKFDKGGKIIIHLEMAKMEMKPRKTAFTFEKKYFSNKIREMPWRLVPCISEGVDLRIM